MANFPKAGQEYVPLSMTNRDKEWERKQRDREYRVASRREKRNRKGDEKKQRKLNATILRRMTRNPDKYNKNAERNRLRDIEGERRKIWQAAIHQVQTLAAIHDPSGSIFNVGPVVKQEDGTVVAEETLRRREVRAREKAAAEEAQHQSITNNASKSSSEVIPNGQNALPLPVSGVNPDRSALIEAVKTDRESNGLSKTQQKKRAALQPRPPPPKPVIPDGIPMLEGEENWLALWDMSDDQLERRIIREKRRKAAERKALRAKQQSGKAERRIARDEKRKVYRDLKLTWKSIKEQRDRLRTKLKSMEDEESKKIAVDINIVERKAALDHCAALGFTLANTAGVDEIKPRALGMRGVEVDFDALDPAENRSSVKVKQDTKQNNKRVNLGDVAKTTKTEYIPSSHRDNGEDTDVHEYIKLDVGEGQDFETLNYNHKLRRKLRRAIDNAEIQKETLVRQCALDYYAAKNIEPPSILQTSYKAINTKGQRILENGSFESPKQDRVRTRMDLAEFNTQMRVLRKQAKCAAIYAGLRKHAELAGKIPVSEPHSGSKRGEEISQSDKASTFGETPRTMKLESSDRIPADDQLSSSTGESSSVESSNQSARHSGISFQLSKLLHDSNHVSKITKRQWTDNVNVHETGRLIDVK